jgi:hypothetical protein
MSDFRDTGKKASTTCVDFGEALAKEVQAELDKLDEALYGRTGFAHARYGQGCYNATYANTIPVPMKRNPDGSFEVDREAVADDPSTLTLEKVVNSAKKLGLL